MSIRGDEQCTPEPGLRDKSNKLQEMGTGQALQLVASLGGHLEHGGGTGVRLTGEAIGRAPQPVA